jgi:hypothetical protein
VALMLKTETLLPGRNTERSISNSMLSMLMNGREIQLRVNSTKSMAFMLKEISTLFLT